MAIVLAVATSGFVVFSKLFDRPIAIEAVRTLRAKITGSKYCGFADPGPFRFNLADTQSAPLASVSVRCLCQGFGRRAKHDPRARH